LLPLSLGVPVALAQDEARGEPREPSPGELYRDVKSLQIVDKLQLTRTQIDKILPVVQKVAAQLQADQAADDAAYEEVQRAAAAVLQALIRGQDPPQEELTAFDRAARQRNAREDARAGMAAQAAADIQRMLTAEQASRIETAAQQANRQALAQRLEGAATPLDYLVRKLEEQTELMPDEYVQTREQRALDIAEALLGKGAPGIRSLATALLGIMDQIASLTPQQYAQLRPTLPDRLAKALDLPPPLQAPPIYYDDFIAWITSERTLVVLQAALEVRPEPEKGQP
jgi:hypothetical protein